MEERFCAMYEADVKGARPTIAPKKLVRAMLVQVLYSVCSERQLVEQINYNLLFRWSVGLNHPDLEVVQGAPLERRTTLRTPEMADARTRRFLRAPHEGRPIVTASNRGVGKSEAERRAWAMVNAETGGRTKSGSGKGHAQTHAPSRKGGEIGGRAAAGRSAAERSASAKKAAATRKRNAEHRA